MLLLGGIKELLYEDGLTIKGVQKVLREEGVSHVAALSPPLDDDTLTTEELESAQDAGTAPEPEAPMVVEAEEERGIVLDFDRREPKPNLPQARENDLLPADSPADRPSDSAPSAPDEPAASPQTPEAPEKPAPAAEPPLEPPALSPIDQSFPEETPEEPAPSDAEEPAAASALPSFLRHPLEDEPAAPADNPPAADRAEVKEPEQPSAPAARPRIVDVGPFRPEADQEDGPGLISGAFRLRSLDRTQAQEIAPLLQRLSSLRDSMASQRRGVPQPGTKD
jgi:hypothetical protein